MTTLEMLFELAGKGKLTMLEFARAGAGINNKDDREHEQAGGAVKGGSGGERTQSVSAHNYVKDKVSAAHGQQQEPQKGMGGEGCGLEV